MDRVKERVSDHIKSSMLGLLVQAPSGSWCYIHLLLFSAIIIKEMDPVYLI